MSQERVASLIPPQVVATLLDKYKIESSPGDYSLYLVRETGERRLVGVHECPLTLRVTQGPHEVGVTTNILLSSFFLDVFTIAGGLQAVPDGPTGDRRDLQRGGAVPGLHHDRAPELPQHVLRGGGARGRQDQDKVGTRIRLQSADIHLYTKMK